MDPPLASLNIGQSAKFKVKPGLNNPNFVVTARAIWLIRKASDGNIIEAYQTWSFEILNPCQEAYIHLEGSVLTAATEITQVNQYFGLVQTLTYYFTPSPQFEQSYVYNLRVSTSLDSAEGPCGPATLVKNA